MKQQAPEVRISLAYEMYRIRKVEEAIADCYGRQVMRCPVHLSIGQEAVAVGVCSQLRRTDYAVSGHRAHAHYLAKGGDLKAMMAEIFGKKTGCAQGRGGSMHLVDLEAGFVGSTPIVGGTIPIGVGIAFAAQLKNEASITAVFFGEGATEEGVFCESLNFAMLKKLRVLFICENNLYSVYSPLSVRQPLERDRVQLAASHGLLALKGNGNDVQEAFRLAKQGIEHLKSGKGPCFLEFDTYRFREHCGPGPDPFQPAEEVSFWQARDPLNGVLREIAEPMKEAVKNEIQEALVCAHAAPFPEPHHAHP